MNVLAIGLSLLLARARGRRLQDLASYQLRGTALFALSLGLQVFLGTTYAESHSTVRVAAPLLNMGSMGLLLWAVGLNWQLHGARVASMAVLANLAVVFANGGKMPVSAETIRAAGMPASRLAYLVAGRSLTHRLMRPQTALPWLGDIYYLPQPFWRSPVFSLGDMLLTLALFVIVQEVMTRGWALRRTTQRLRKSMVPMELDEADDLADDLDNFAGDPEPEIAPETERQEQPEHPL